MSIAAVLQRAALLAEFLDHLVQEIGCNGHTDRLPCPVEPV